VHAIIGRYKVSMEETGLVIRHPTGLSFDLEPFEVLGLWNFIGFYREPLTDKQFETDPQHKATDAEDTEELIDYNKRWRDKQP
jgi:hypothetical protein